jgi:hypothetical protein
MLLGLVLVAVVAVAMPALGASPIKTAKRALRTGKKANKTAKKADRRARRALKQIKEGVPEADHATNADNATNATNATNAGNSNALGGTGASDYRRYSGTIPSGKTVVGAWGLHANNLNDNEDTFVTISFPLPSAAAYDAHFAPSAFADDDDPSCTGSFTDPTAPPRKVCIYIGATHVDVDGLIGTGGVDSFGFGIRGTATMATADVEPGEPGPTPSPRRATPR